MEFNEAHLAQSVERPAFKAGPYDYVNRAAMGSSPIVGVPFCVFFFFFYISFTGQTKETSFVILPPEQCQRLCSLQPQVKLPLGVTLPVLPCNFYKAV
jgi:hypothetical protein